MNADSIPSTTVMVKGGQLLDLSFPIELILPVITKPAHEIECGSVLPPRGENFVRPASMGQAGTQVLDSRFGIGQEEWLDTHGRKCNLCHLWIAGVTATAARKSVHVHPPRSSFSMEV